jgi:hypothetical protein
MLMSSADEDDPLMELCAAVLHEIGAYQITTDRIRHALPVIRSSLAAIRELDELELDAIEPAVVFKPEQ